MVVATPNMVVVKAVVNAVAAAREMVREAGAAVVAAGEVADLHDLRVDPKAVRLQVQLAAVVVKAVAIVPRVLAGQGPAAGGDGSRRFSQG